MNKKYDALEWQIFSQKKNVEEIAKNTRERSKLELSLIIESLALIFSIALEDAFKGELAVLFKTLLIIIVMVTFFVVISPYIKRFLRRIRPGADIPKLDDMIALFDNEICYYALMAESYLDKFYKDKNNMSEDVKQFYFIEANFYVNKAIYNLSVTQNSIDKLYSKDSEDIYVNRQISYTRLINILNILDECIDKIGKDLNVIQDIDVDKNHVNLFIKYIQEYLSFKQEISKKFSDERILDCTRKILCNLEKHINGEVNGRP